MFSKKSSLGADAITLTVSRVLVSLLGLVTSMLLARFRTLEEYGTYSQIIMVADLVSTILLLGLPNSVNYFLARAETKEEKQRFMSVYITLSTVLTFVITACMYVCLPLIINYFDNPLISAFAYVFAIYPWSSVMINSLGNTCVVFGKANRLIFFSLSQSLLSLLLLLAAKAFNINFKTYLYMHMALLFLFALFAVLWMSSLSGGIRIKLNLSLVKEIFVFSIPMGLASVVGTLNVELDKLVISKFFTTEEYAIFANAAKELPLTMFAGALTAVLLPQMVRLIKKGENERAVSLWSNAANISFCVMSLFVGGLFVFAKDVMTLFYSAKYVSSASITVFRIYTLILFFRAIYFGIVLNATGKTKLIFLSSILTLVLNFVLNIGFCYIIGFSGPAYASLCATLLMEVVQLLFTCKILSVNFSKILPWKSIAIRVLQTIVLGFLFFEIKNVFFSDFNSSSSIIVSILLGVLWTVVYVLINKNFIVKNFSELNKDRVTEGADNEKIYS